MEVATTVPIELTLEVRGRFDAPDRSAGESIGELLSFEVDGALAAGAAVMARARLPGIENLSPALARIFATAFAGEISDALADACRAGG